MAVNTSKQANPESFVLSEIFPQQPWDRLCREYDFQNNFPWRIHILWKNRFKSYFKVSMIIYVLHTCSEIPKRPTGTPGVHLKALIWYDFSKVAWFSWELITACWLQTLPLSKRVTACSDLLVPSPRTSSFQHICIFWSPSFVIRISKAGSCFPTFHVYFCLSVFVLCSCHENTWKILVLF